MSASRILLGLALCVSAVLTFTVMAAWRVEFGGGYRRFTQFWRLGTEATLGSIGLTGLTSVTCKEIRAKKKSGSERKLLGGNCYIGFPPGREPSGKQPNDQIAFENDLLITHIQRSARLGKVARL
jgi:hypothetical protein